MKLRTFASFGEKIISKPCYAPLRLSGEKINSKPCFAPLRLSGEKIISQCSHKTE